MVRVVRSPKRPLSCIALLIVLSLAVQMPLIFWMLRQDLKLYEPVITKEERWIMLSLLSKFDRVMKHYNVTYMMYGGTLLGSHRHHGLIPWDDDVDLLLNKTYREQLPEMLKRMEPNLTLYSAGGHDKISHPLSRRTNKFSWRWPYLDVSYFEENSTHIWDHMSTYSRWFFYPKSITLPLHQRPFDHLWLPAPKDTLAFLQLTYGITDTCLTSAYSHIIEDGMPSENNPCSILNDKVAFVHRQLCNANAQLVVNDTCVIEKLQVGSRVVQTLIVAEPSFAINEPFSMKLVDGFKQPPHYPLMPTTDMY